MKRIVKRNRNKEENPAKKMGLFSKEEQSPRKRRNSK